MEVLISEFWWKVLVLSLNVVNCALAQNLLSCETTSIDASGYRCGTNGLQNKCNTFVVLRTSSHYSSLFNLSYYLGINKFVVAKTNGFSADTEYLPKDRPLLIPVECKCSSRFFQAELTRTAVRGESFYSISETLEGLTTCKALKENNPGISPRDLRDGTQLRLPLRCACPSEKDKKKGLLLTYPVNDGDTLSSLALKFNIPPKAIISANSKLVKNFKPEKLVPLTSILIPLSGQIDVGSLTKPEQPNLQLKNFSVPVVKQHKKRSKMSSIQIYIALSGVGVGITIAVGAVIMVLRLKRRKLESCKAGNLVNDVEVQQLGLSVRTTSDKKVSFEGSQCPLEGSITSSTPHKLLVETYTIEELRKATEDFNQSNHIEGSVYHGRLLGKSLAIKRASSETIRKMDFSLFHDATHKHPNIIRLLGTCLTEGPDSYLVFEYAKNGSLKDWLHHRGLAIKSQFIASCDCFLTWNQRMRICLDVAMALQYMHHIMNPCYVHQNVKSRNIFLDEEFNAKIGNFGMSTYAEEDATNPQLCPEDPSLGYLAPEYIRQGTMSTSLDIFAYGVVILEVLSGQPPVIQMIESPEVSIRLSEKIRSILQSDNADELREWMDRTLSDDYSFDAAVTLANLARACTEEDPSLRPTAGDIVERLSKFVEQVPAENNLMSESSCKPLVKAAE